MKKEISVYMGTQVAPEERKQFTDAEIKKAYKDARVELSETIRYLLDNENEGGMFYAHIVQQMCRTFTHTACPTAGVSVTDKIVLYINPLFWMHTLKDRSQRAAVLRHEILHLIFHHCSRVQDFGNKVLSNIAADLVVNSQINPTVFGDMRKSFIFPDNFGLPHDETLQWYYENYPIEDHPICESPNEHDEEYKQQGQQGQGQQGKGSKGESDQDDKGSGHGDPGHHDHAIGPDGKCKVCGGVRPLDAHGLWDEQEMNKASEAMRKSLITDAINRAANAGRNAGNLPNAVKQAIELAKKKPQIPWQSVLRTFTSKLSRGELNYTKKRFSKRFGVRPGTVIRPKLKVLLSLDVSGSIGNPEYNMFINEGLAILKNQGIDAVEILEWDAAITSTDRRGNPGAYPLKKGYTITRTGCGGTSPKDAIEWVNAHRGDYDGVIWFTDGYFFTDPGTKLRLPNLWVITNDGSDEYLKEKYRVIRLPQKEGDDAT